MKLEIELDLNKIDYDAINQQIQEKIESMDLAKEYNIGYKIESKIREEVENKVRSNMNGWYGGLNDDTKRNIKDEISKNIRETVSPIVGDVLGKIPQEEFNSIIRELLPVIFMNVLMTDMGSMFHNYYCSMNADIMHQCEDRIASIFR